VTTSIENKEHLYNNAKQHCEISSASKTSNCTPLGLWHCFMKEKFIQKSQFQKKRVIDVES
jgi:hypothetical protein